MNESSPWLHIYNWLPEEVSLWKSWGEPAIPEAKEMLWKFRKENFYSDDEKLLEVYRSRLKDFLKEKEKDGKKK